MTTLKTSLVRLQSLQEDEDNTIKRIHELENILADDTLGQVTLSKAKVELATLQKQVQKGSRRASVRNLGSSGVATKNRALFNKYEEERKAHEEEIRQLHVQLQTAGIEERKRLEELLKNAQKKIAELELEEAGTTAGDEQSIGQIKDEEELKDTSIAIAEAVDKVGEDNNETHKEDEDNTDGGIDKRKSTNETKRPSVSFLEGEGIVTRNRGSYNDTGASEADILRGSGIKLNGLPDASAVNTLFTEVTQGPTDCDTADKVKVVDNNQEDTNSLEYWRAKAEELQLKCYAFEAVVEGNEKSIAELTDQNKNQADEIAILKAQLKSSPPTPRPNLLTGRGSMGSGKSRRFSTRALSNPSLRAQLKRASMSGDMNEQMKETAKVELMALEEALKEMDGERGDLLKELEMMKAILAAANGEKQGKKTERLVYQLSCKKCNQHMNFVGTTHTDLKTTMERHFDLVVKAAKSSNKDKTFTYKRKSSGGSACSDTSTGSSGGKKESWAEEFANHFAKHATKRRVSSGVFKSVSEKDIIKFCRENVKVEVLRRGDGAELMWEEEEE